MILPRNLADRRDRFAERKQCCGAIKGEKDESIVSVILVRNNIACLLIPRPEAENDAEIRISR